MDRHADASAGTAVGPDTARGVLWRAALLAGHGPGARDLADLLLACTRGASTRTCLDAGSPLQLTVEAPGSPTLRVGLRLGESIDPGALSALLGDPPARRILDAYARVRAADLQLPAAPAWLFWSASGHELAIPLDPSRRETALALASQLLGEQRRRLRRPQAAIAAHTRAWALSFASESAQPEAGLHPRLASLVERTVGIDQLAERAGLAGWPLARRTALQVLGRNGLGGRWLVTESLDADTPSVLRIGASAWALVPDDDRKRDHFATICETLLGPRSWAESLWTLCRSNAGPRCRVGRAIELRISDDQIGARWFLVPRC